MTVMYEFSPDANLLTIAINGRFDFSLHQAFREAYETLTGRPDSVVLDLKKATYVDSCALGMLLLLRVHAGGDDAVISVVNSSPDVRKTLTLSNFDKLFDIS